MQRKRTIDHCTPSAGGDDIYHHRPSNGVARTVLNARPENQRNARRGHLFAQWTASLESVSSRRVCRSTRSQICSAQGKRTIGRCTVKPSAIGHRSVERVSHSSLRVQPWSPRRRSETSRAALSSQLDFDLHAPASDQDYLSALVDNTVRFGIHRAMAKASHHTPLRQ